MIKAFKNILIIGHSNIGDVCYDLVVVKPLRINFPEARISFLTSPGAQNIVANTNGLDRVIVFDRKVTDQRIFGRFPFMVSLRKEKFDLAIVFKSTSMHHFLGIPHVWSLRKYLGCKISDKKRHVVDIYLDFLRFHRIDNPEAVFELNTQSRANFSDQFLAHNKISPGDKIVGICPLAAWSLKNWPVGKWNDLAQILADKYGFKVMAFGKSGNDVFSRSVLEKLSPGIISAIDKTTLVEALALIKRCDFFIGPDSGLLHLASCMKVKTIGLYGATSKNFLYPYFHRHNIVASKAELPCMPCYPGNTPCQRVGKSLCGQCMEAIEVEDVLAIIENRLAGPIFSGYRGQERARIQ